MKTKITTIKTTQEFTETIDSLVASGYDYIDAIVHYCTENNVEIETAASLVKSSPKLKANIKDLAEMLNLMKRKKK